MRMRKFVIEFVLLKVQNRPHEHTTIIGIHFCTSLQFIGSTSFFCVNQKCWYSLHIITMNACQNFGVRYRHKFFNVYSGVSKYMLKTYVLIHVSINCICKCLFLEMKEKVLIGGTSQFYI